MKKGRLLNSQRKKDQNFFPHIEGEDVERKGGISSRTQVYFKKRLLLRERTLSPWKRMKNRQSGKGKG